MIRRISIPAAPVVALGLTMGTLMGTATAAVSSALDHNPAFAAPRAMFVCTNGTETVVVGPSQAAQLRQQGYTCRTAGGK